MAGPRRSQGRKLSVERLEPRLALSGQAITPTDVTGLLNRAAAASSATDAIIAVVDRSGNILGVRVEKNVAIATADTTTLDFAIDGAVSLARTGAFFANGQAPLTSRTVRFISQSTITQREVESSPESADPTHNGPGYVAPIGIGNHFPPGVTNAPQVDLFGIEQTNRGINIPDSALAAGAALPNTEAFAQVAGFDPTAQSRGIATLPGGIPLFKNGVLVGGIGVFFPGPHGYATYEQNFHPVANPNDPNAEFQAEYNRTNAPLVLEAEWMAFAATGGINGSVPIPPLFRPFAFPVGTLGVVHTAAPVPGYGLPIGQLNLVGITLDVFGPGGNYRGEQSLHHTQITVGRGDALEQKLPDFVAPNNGTMFTSAPQVPNSGWLVAPHTSASGDLTAADVTRIVNDGIAQANVTRAAIRLNLQTGLSGATARMVFAVADHDGSILGLYRMPDSTIFSIDVAVAKARNTVYYADAAKLQPVDQVVGVPAGVAFTNRTFRALAEPHFPGGIDNKPPGPFSSLLAPGIDPRTAEDLGAPLAASVYINGASELMYTSFAVGHNFHDTADPLSNQNGVVYFPGSSPLYRNGTKMLIAGFGVSGDGVDQDDVVTIAGQQGFAAPPSIRADQFVIRGVRLPYQKGDRNPQGGV
jgi:uncharacterized protein GlcG (DUF336 family)